MSTRTYLKPVIPPAVFIVIMILLIRCNPGNVSAYSRIREHADKIKVINTHEHQHLPQEFSNYKFRFYHLVAASYLSADITSAGVNAGDWKLIDSVSIDSLWEIYGKALDYTRSTSYYNQFIRGFRKLYGFSDPWFTKENISVLSPEIEKNYADYETWFDSAFQKSGFDLMFIDQYWKPFNTVVDKKHFALAFNINELIAASGKRPVRGSQPRSVYGEAAKDSFVIENFDDYLRYCDRLFSENIAAGAVCIKNAQAYSRTLYYEDVPYEEAERLFEKDSPALTPQESRKIEDFMFHWIIKKASESDLPIQIHTGYLAGNGNVLENGQPVKLNNLFMQYPKAKFILFHGGFPWTGECAALAKMFPNVYLDLVWLPQISGSEAVRALDEMFDCVPYNKFFWGGDCSLIEESAGSLEIGKDVVSEVLAKRVERGLLTEEVAIDMLDRIFRENAIEVFKLADRLAGRPGQME